MLDRSSFRGEYDAKSYWRYHLALPQAAAFSYYFLLPAILIDGVSPERSLCSLIAFSFDISDSLYDLPCQTYWSCGFVCSGMKDGMLFTFSTVFHMRLRDSHPCIRLCILNTLLAVKKGPMPVSSETTSPPCRLLRSSTGAIPVPIRLLPPRLLF